MVRSQIVRKINSQICGLSKGFYTDDYWAGVQYIQNSFKELEKLLNVDIILNNSKYENYEDIMPTSKRWVYLVDSKERKFKNQIMIVIIASGAGTVSDPLSKYDVISYAS